MQKKWLTGIVFSTLAASTLANSYAKENLRHFDMLATGTYNHTNHTSQPFLVEGREVAGYRDSWFPRAYDLIESAPRDIADNTTFNSAKCTNKFCVATGSYINKNALRKPLLAVNSSPNSWSFISILPPQYTEGGFNAVNCNAAFCTVVGFALSKSNQQLPVLMTSTDGKTWSSPETIATHLPKDIEKPELTNVICDDNGCIAIGSHKDGEHTFPLVAISSDQGKTWNYSMNFLDKKSNANNVILKKLRCDKNTCVIAGTYEASGNIHLPFLAVSNDKGQNWFYPNSILENMPDGIHSVDIRDLFCHDGTCIIVGYFDEKDFPLLAISKDNGATWTYPSYKRGDKSGFDAVNCYENKCLAAGSFVNNYNQSLLLYAYSNNQGINWYYGYLHDIEVKISGVACNKDACVVSGSRKDSRLNIFDPAIFSIKNDFQKSKWWITTFQFPQLPEYKSGNLSSVDNAMTT